MDEKLFECGICLELCQKCINCLKCNQIYCRKHVKDLPEDKCPSCRDAPFRYQENIALQRIIRDLRERAGLPEPPEPPPSPRELARELEPPPERRRAELERRRARRNAAPDQPEPTPAHPEPASEESGEERSSYRELRRARRSARRRDASEEEEPVPENDTASLRDYFRDFIVGTSQALENVITPTRIDPRIGTKVPRPGRPNEFKKQPSDRQADIMKRHVRTCTNEGCHCVWNGPWGQFIGGRQGSTHFDLTECSEGTRLNRAIGWNYDDPTQ